MGRRDKRRKKERVWEVVDGKVIRRDLGAIQTENNNNDDAQDATEQDVRANATLSLEEKILQKLLQDEDSNSEDGGDDR